MVRAAASAGRAAFDRRVIAAAALLAMAAAGGANAEEGVSYPSSGANIYDTASLQRGAHNFINYCSGCHSMKYVRYNRMATDLKIPGPELDTLMLTSKNVYDTIVSSMPPDAQNWFGKQPPDLSLMARSRGVDYIYAYLKDYYVDKTRPWGVNNLVLPGTAMPDVVATLQGTQKPIYKSEQDEHGNATLVLVGVEAMSPGTMKPEEYDRFARDTANFLDYAGEPIKAKRQSMGWYVMVFLLVFFVLAYFLKKEYWKDVH